MLSSGLRRLMGFPLGFLRGRLDLHNSQHCPPRRWAPPPSQHPPFTLCMHIPCLALGPHVSSSWAYSFTGTQNLLNIEAMG